jgi:hypothetical protein
MSGKTPGQLIHESLCESAVAEFGMPIEAFQPWDQVRESQRTRLEAAAAAVETEQLLLAREDRDAVRERMLALAAELEDEAARNDCACESKTAGDAAKRIRKGLDV